MKGLMNRSSTALFVFGVLAVVFGVVAAVFPVGTALTLIVLWGIYALLDGIAAAVMAFRPAEDQSRGFLILTAVFGIAAGLLAILHPIGSAVALAWILGVWLMVRGVLELVGAFSGKQSNSRWLLVLGGVLWLVAGWLVVSSPGVAALSISLWLGVLAIVWGIVLLVAGFRARSAAKQSPEASAQVPPT